MTKIKFCGLREPRDAAHATQLGAAYGGVIMTSSARQVSPDMARDIFGEAPSLKRVGVIGRETVPRILVMAAEAGLDILQLHGNYSVDEHAELRQEFDGQIWAVIGMDRITGAPVRPWKEVTDVADALLLDTSDGGSSGGTGKTFNWQASAPIVREMSREIPVILAGGLSPQNVAQAIAELRPSVVDVSSGVESSPGRKSHELMSAFAKAVLSASIV